MTLIKPRTRGKQFVRHITRLERENNETLFAYAAFIAESTEYVLNQLVDTVLAKDKEFAQWRAEHPESFVRRQTTRRRPKSDRPITTPGAAWARTDGAAGSGSDARA